MQKKSFGLKAAILTASMMTMMANAIIAPATPAIKAAFINVPNAEFLVKMMLTLPSLGIVLTAPFLGIILDKFGRIKVLIISLIIYALAGTTGLWLNDLYHILFGRLILGFGVSGIMTAATTLIGDYFTDKERNSFIGIQGAFMGLGGMTFISLAGVLSEMNWRYPFYIYGFSVLVLVLASTYLYEPDIKKEAKQSSDTAAVPFWKTFRGVLFILFSGFFGMAVFYVIPVQLPFYVESIDGVSKKEAGLAIAAMTLTQTIMAIFYRKIRDRFHFKSIYAICFTLMGIGFLILGFSSTYIESLIGAMVVGLGAGWLMPNASLWMMAVVDASVRGRFIGILSMFTFSGMLFSPALVQPLQNMYGLRSSFTAIAIILIPFILIYLFSSLKQQKRKKTESLVTKP